MGKKGDREKTSKGKMKPLTFGQTRIDLREEMSQPLERFYNVNRIFLSMVGLWPYQEDKTKFLRTLCVQVILFCGTTSHFVKLISMDYDLDIFIDLLPFTFLFLCIITMYSANLIYANVVKVTWDRILDDWNELMNAQEINLLEHYASLGKLYASTFIAMFYAGEMFLILQTLLPVFLDIVLPLNESRPFQSFIPMEVMFDQEKHIFPTVLLLSFALGNVGLVAAATYGSFAVYIQHACGMFRLVGLTLDEAYEVTDKKLYTNKENERIYKNLIRSIRLHRRAIEFINFINTIYDKPYLMQLTMAVFIVGLNIIQFMKIKAQQTVGSDIIMCLLQIFGSLSSGCIINFMCQNVINTSMDIFEQAYATPWHMCCPKTQRLLLMLMMNSLKPCYITLGNMFISCNEFYATFLQTTMSYAIVIYSLQ